MVFIVCETYIAKKLASSSSDYGAWAALPTSPCTTRKRSSGSSQFLLLVCRHGTMEALSETVDYSLHEKIEMERDRVFREAESSLYRPLCILDNIFLVK